MNNVALTARARFSSVLLRSPLSLVATVVLAGVVLASLCAPLVTWHDPSYLLPRLRLQGVSGDYWMGTDALGRDVFSRVLYGARLSILLGLMVCFIATAVGLLLGLLAGYYRRLDALLMRVMDGVMAIPGLLLAITLVALVGPSLTTMVVAIAIPEIPRVARLVRSVVLSVREEPYVEASLGLGAGNLRVIVRHILPSTINPLVIQVTFIFVAAILTEAILGFLGAGFPPQVPSLGGIIADGRPYFQRAPWIVLFPGIYLAFIVLAVNIFGDALRDRLDPRLARKQRG